MADETAWLIEVFGQGSPTYYGKTDEGVLGLTNDHNAAVRFSREQDAQMVIEDIGWTEAQAIEHMWCDGKLRSCVYCGKVVHVALDECYGRDFDLSKLPRLKYGALIARLRKRAALMREINEIEIEGELLNAAAALGELKE